MISLLSLLQACCVEYIILESDNLSSLFPNAHLSLGAFELNSHHLFALLTTLAVLPTVWLRDLSILSYISGEFINHFTIDFQVIIIRTDKDSKNIAMMKLVNSVDFVNFCSYYISTCF